MRQDDGIQFDFDEWAELAARDPDAFEAQRARALEQFIEQAPSERRQRLRQLQWRIDAERGRASNPLSACLRISRMMWDTLLGKGGLIEAIERLSGRPAPVPTAAKPARVLEFRPRH